VDVDKFDVSEYKEDYYLTASRMVPYKRLDLVIDAFNDLPDKNLIVIGSGPEKEKLISKASSNIKIIGHQETEKLKVYMQKAKAFVFAAEEDFGIIVVEAMACGTPVIAWNYGGTGESVIDGETGILFTEQTKNSIITAVKKFEDISGNFNPELIRKHSKNFSRMSFENNIKNFVDEKVKLFFNTEKHLISENKNDS
jgi:glycosyltransferase involved in cell wall biosynthesis